MRLSVGYGMLLRAGYLLSMYTGTRAAWNRARSTFLPAPQSAILDGRVLYLNESPDVLIRVHARVPPHPLPRKWRAGMFSACLLSPGIPRPVYALLRMTSHFGCGHLEVAFYECGGAVVIYAIRNIVKANAARIGCEHLLRNLDLGEESDEILVLRGLVQTLGAHGLQTSFASPEDCVTFAVNDLLLRPAKRVMTRAILRVRYTRIWSQAEMPDSAVHVRTANIIDTLGDARRSDR